MQLEWKKSSTVIDGISHDFYFLNTPVSVVLAGKVAVDWFYVSGCNLTPEGEWIQAPGFASAQPNDAALANSARMIGEMQRKLDESSATCDRLLTRSAEVDHDNAALRKRLEHLDRAETLAETAHRSAVEMEERAAKAKQERDELAVKIQRLEAWALNESAGYTGDCLHCHIIAKKTCLNILRGEA